MEEPDQKARFEQLLLPHLDAAYNLARWLTRNEHDAKDVVQEAFLRAYRFFGKFHGENCRAWLLTIVRNTTYSWLQKNRKHELTTTVDDELHEIADPEPNPAMLLLKNADRQEMMRAIESLPLEFREALILRELEGMSYKEIAELSEVPIGTVMSRLARARRQLERVLTQQLHSELTR